LKNSPPAIFATAGKRGERVYKSGHHVVAMNGEAPSRIGRGRAEADRNRLARIKQCAGESRSD
jgi:hypothetical protein